MPKKVLLFDFDGVIVDSFDAAFGVSKTIYPPLEKEEYVRRFDGNINSSLGGNRSKEGYRTDVDFFEEYVPLILKIPIVPGMKEIMELLALEYHLFIVSSTITGAIRKYLKRYGIASCFKNILGNDIHASKFEKIKMIFDQYDVKSEECLFITDTLGDIREADLAKVPAIAVTWGYQSRETLTQGHPLAIVDSPKELFNAIQKYFSEK